MKVKSLSRVRLLATPWTAAYQAPPSMGFSRQKYWSGVPLPRGLDLDLNYMIILVDLKNFHSNPVERVTSRQIFMQNKK